MINKKNLTKKELLIKIVATILFLGIMVGVIVYANTNRPGYTTTEDSGVEYETAKVLQITSDNTTVDETVEGVRKGNMEMKVELLTGRYKGNVSFVTNYFSALYNVNVKEGDKISVRVDTTGVDEYSVSVYNYNRIPLMIGLVVIFLLALVLVGGMSGVKAFVGLAYTVICIVFILLPLSLRGFDTIPLTCVIVFVTSAFCFFLIGGIQKKTIVAALGSLCGVVIAAVFAQAAASIGGVTTFQMEEAEALLLVKSTFDLKMRGLLISGILIAAMGAVMDVSMTISSALEEIHAANARLTVKELFRSGMKIGRDAMGTMANTLVLAFVGNSLNMMVLIYSYGVSFTQLMNTDFVAIEMIRAIAGSIGIIFTVPCVALMAAYAYKGKRKE